jgi:putative ABC transport system permease protein
MLREPAEPSALISEQLAEEDGLALGSALTMQGRGERTTFRVIGILAGDGPLNCVFGRVVVVPLETAQAVFGEAAVTRVDLGLAPGADLATVSAALEDRLRFEPYVLSTPQEIAASLRASTADFQATTSLIAAIALFAGAFLVFNTLSMTVIEQVRDVGLLRAAGATRRQVTRFMLTQAVAIGLLGLGVALAAAMVTWVRTVGSVTLERPATPPDAALIAFLVGIGVTVAAALEPARRAGRIPPVEALKSRLDLPAARRARLRWLAAVFVLVSLVGLAVAPRGAGVVSSLVVYAILLVGTLLTPFILPAVARGAGIPFALVLRFEERLARASVVRDPSRTALTLGALTIGLRRRPACARGGRCLDRRRDPR